MTDIFGDVIPFTQERLSEEVCCDLILDSGQFSIHDVAGGEEPFEYSASTPLKPFYGPGYLLVKALVGFDETFFTLVNQLALRIAEIRPEFDMVVGNVSGGMTPAYLLKLYLDKIYGRRVVYNYARDMRKPHGSSEIIVGFADNPHVRPGMNVLDVEELVNKANTTCNAVLTLRNVGTVCNYAATILDYQNPDAIEARRQNDLTEIYVTTLPVLLGLAEQRGLFSAKVLADYRRFLDDPNRWQVENREAIQKAVAKKNVQEVA